MRIAMLTNNYKPYMGGVPVSIEHLAQALRAQGHEVYIFAPTYKNQVDEEYVIRYPSFPFSIAKAPIPNVFSSIFEEKIIGLGIDVIHVHHPALVGNVALRMKKKYGIPVVFTYHTRVEAYLHYVKPIEWLEHATGIIKRYMRWFCNQCDMIAAPTDGIRDYLVNHGVKTPIEVLPTGVKEESFYPKTEQVQEIRRRYKGEANYLLCSVSRLAKEKNIDFQLKGLKHLKEELKGKGKNFRYLLIGDGPEQEHLKKKIKDMNLENEVILAGRVENEYITSYQKACDAFLFSSKSETQGIVILEAMAAGNPVIAVDASGVKDIVENGVNGYLTKEEPLEWANQIATVLLDELHQTQLSYGAYITATKYSENQIAQKAAEAYNKTVCYSHFQVEERTWQLERVWMRGKAYLWNH